MTLAFDFADPTEALIRAADLLDPASTGYIDLEPYWYDPVGFVDEFIPRLQLTDYQRECLSYVCTDKKVCVRGPHGLGKTAMVAGGLVLWFALTREDMCRKNGGDWKCVTTASVYRQLEKFLWPEVRKWARNGGIEWLKLGREPFSRRYELITTQLKLEHGEAFAVSSDEEGNIEGAHADHLLYVIDEGKSVKAETFDAVEGAFSGAGADTINEAYCFVISTPGEPTGRFYDIQSRKKGYEDWKVRAVTVDEAIAAKRVSLEWVNQRREQWGEGSALFQNRVLGNFATDASNGVIPIAWVELAMARNWPDNEPSFTCCGVDVGRGHDRSIIAKRFGNCIAPLDMMATFDASKGVGDTMELAGKVAKVLNFFARSGYASIDTIGIGAGVFDRLAEQGFDLEGFNAGESSRYTDSSGEIEFANRRAEAWWNLRELLNPANNNNIVLPDDEELLGDLVTPHYKTTSLGKIQIESKDDIIKRIGRSTDRGDSVVMAFAPRYYDPISTIVDYEDRVSISPI